MTAPHIGAADLDRAREGDVDSFLRLVQPYDRELRAFAYRMLGDRNLMDDVLQEVYLSAFRSIRRFRAEASLRTWLYRIARNRCIDLIRARRIHEDIDDHPVVEGSFDSAVAGRLDLERALSRLTPEHREILMIVDASGFDYQTAAEVLGIRIGTVRSRLARARENLRALMEEDHV